MRGNDPLDEMRRKANDLDEQLVELLGRRRLLTRQMMLYKKSLWLPPGDAAREQAQNTLLSLWADQFGLEREMVVKIYNVIREYAKRDYPEGYDSWD